MVRDHDPEKIYQLKTSSRHEGIHIIQLVEKLLTAPQQIL